MENMRLALSHLQRKQDNDLAVTWLAAGVHHGVRFRDQDRQQPSPQKLAFA